LLAATDTIMFGVAMGAMSVVLVYTRRQFDWHELESGRFTTIVNSSRVFALLVILPILTRIFRGKNGAARLRSSGSDLFDLSVIRAAIFFDMAGFIGYALARKGELFALSGAIAAVGGIGSPTLGAALTKHVPQDQVGQLLGATGLLHAVARVVGPTIFNGIYSATVGTYRQTVFVCLAATFGTAFVCSWFIRPHGKLQTHPHCMVDAHTTQYISTKMTNALRRRMDKKHSLLPSMLALQSQSFRYLRSFGRHVLFHRIYQCKQRGRLGRHFEMDYTLSS